MLSDVRLIFVHGTFANPSTSSIPAWWDGDSEFSHGLTDALLARGVRVTDIIGFTWSGENSETARRAGGCRLAALMRECERTGQRYAVVAHSHGGSVARHALIELDCRGIVPAHLVSCISVGTPYLEYSLDPWRLVMVAPGLVGMAALMFGTGFVREELWATMLDLVFFREIGTLLWLSLAAVLVLAMTLGTGTYVAKCVLSRLSEMNRVRCLHRTVSDLGDRYVALVTAGDEAIGALRVSVMLSGPLVPRIRSRIAVPYNWCVAPVGDRYIWYQLARRSQGADVVGLDVSRVSTHPAAGATTVRLSAEAEQTMDDLSARAAPTVVHQLRTTLLRYAVVPSMTRLLETPAYWEILQHTRYFDIAQVRQLIAATIAHSDDFAVRAAETPSSVADRPTRHAVLHTVMASIAAVVIAAIGLTAYPRLRRLDPDVLRGEYAAAAPVFEALWQSSSAAADSYVAPYMDALTAQTASDAVNVQIAASDRAPDPALFLGYVSAALMRAGRWNEAKTLLDAAKSRVTLRLRSTDRGVVPPGLATIVRLMGRAGQHHEVAALLARVRVAPHSADAAHVLLVRGLVDADQIGVAIETLNAIRSNDFRQEAAEAIFERTPSRDSFARIIVGFPEERRDDVIAAGLSVVGHAWRSDDISSFWKQIEKPKPRLIATPALVKALVRDNLATEARTLLVAESEALRARPAATVSGVAGMYMTVAESFLELGDRSESERWLAAADAAATIRRGNTVTYELSNEGASASLWARLGRPVEAVTRANGVALANREELYRKVGQELAGHGDATAVEQAIATIPTPYHRFMAILGATETKLGADPSLAAYHKIARLTAQARELADPAQRSRALAQCAMLWSRVGNQRRALLESAECDAADRMLVLSLVLTEKRRS